MMKALKKFDPSEYVWMYVHTYMCVCSIQCAVANCSFFLPLFLFLSLFFPFNILSFFLLFFSLSPGLKALRHKTEGCRKANLSTQSREKVRQKKLNIYTVNSDYNIHGYKGQLVVLATEIMSQNPH